MMDCIHIDLLVAWVGEASMKVPRHKCTLPQPMFSAKADSEMIARACLSFLSLYERSTPDSSTTSLRGVAAGEREPDRSDCWFASVKERQEHLR